MHVGGKLFNLTFLQERRTSGYQIALKYPKWPPDGLEINPKSLPHGSKSTPNAQGVAKNCPGGSKMCSK